MGDTCSNGPHLCTACRRCGLKRKRTLYYGVYQELFDWDPLRMPSVSTLTDAASSWIKLGENARAELRLGGQVKRRSDKDAVVADLECAQQHLAASQRRVNRAPVVVLPDCHCRMRPSQYEANFIRY